MTITATFDGQRFDCGPRCDHGSGVLGRVVVSVSRKAGRARLDDGTELPVVEAYDHRRDPVPVGDPRTRFGVAEMITAHGLPVGFAFDLAALPCGQIFGETRQ